MWVVNFGLERSAKYTYNWHKNVKKKRYMMNLFSICLIPFNELNWGLRNRSDSSNNYPDSITLKYGRINRKLITYQSPQCIINEKIGTKVNSNLDQIHPWLRFLNVEEIEEV